MVSVEKWFYFSDMQMPHHDQQAIDLAFKVMKSYKPDVVVNIGDLADGTGTSRWADGTTEEVVAQAMAEAQDVKDYWAKVRKTAPNARLIWTEGNHDLRPFDYVDKKAPALKDLITPESLWDLSTYGVEYIKYDAPPQITMGDIYVHHGVAVSKHAGGSVQSDMESFGVSLVRGHSHRMGVYSKTYELRDTTIRGYEIGHLMQVDEATYTQVHNWQLGFAIGVNDDGTGHIDLVPIYPGYVCYVGGKRFSL
jgi:predicted phosphodiesterase